MYNVKWIIRIAIVPIFLRYAWEGSICIALNQIKMLERKYGTYNV